MTTTIERPKISALPSGWPTDKRTRRYEVDGETFISHPDRDHPYRYDETTRTWKEIVR